MALATAANTGSVATLVGNPQNMLCAMLGNLTYREHLVLVGPLAIFCLGINHALLWLVFRRRLAPQHLDVGETGSPFHGRTGLTLAVIGATAVAYTIGADLSWAATAGFVALMIIRHRSTRDLWTRIDWSVLLFFAGLFVVVEAFVRSGAPVWLFDRVPLDTDDGDVVGVLRLSLIFLVGSNVVSNVPFILVVADHMRALAEPTLGWELLAVASTFAGNLTLLGSVANIIVAESARDVGGIGFVEYLKVGVPLATVTTLVGALWLHAFL
jgi:Na+/H+ antiporter NhaD/arsenite permease-like protein